MSGVDKRIIFVLVDTGEKCAAGVADTRGKFAAAVNEPRTGDQCKSWKKLRPPVLLTLAVFFDTGGAYLREFL